MSLLNIGDVIELDDGHKVNADLPKHFLYANKRGCWELARGGVTISPALSHLRGKYVVVMTTTDGGGQSHDGGYPDGHHVWCQHMECGHRVDFWQTGCFITMNTDIKAIGKAVPQTWSITETPSQ